MPLLSWLRRTFASSIGKKTLMALTGLLLVLFLIAHLAGNLTIFADSRGETFDAYSHALRSNPLLPLAELGLAALFLTHITLGVMVSLENWRARSQRYARRASHGGRTAGSATMVITGSMVLVFLLVHLYDFRLQVGPEDALAPLVKSRLAGAGGLAIYVLGVGALGLHLSHAFRSALQTLGVNHPRFNGLIRGVGLSLAILVGLGFVAFPLVYFFGGEA